MTIKIYETKTNFYEINLIVIKKCSIKYTHIYLYINMFNKYYIFYIISYFLINIYILYSFNFFINVKT